MPGGSRRRSPSPARPCPRAASGRRRRVVRPTRLVAPDARSTLPRLRSASTKRGNSDCIDSVSTSPAWMPPSSGCGDEATVAAPNRRRKNAATDSSSRGAARAATSGSSASRARATAAAGVAERAPASVGGMPSTDGDGSGCSRRRFRTNAVRGGRRRDQPRAEPELPHSCERRRLLRQHRIGPGVDREAVDVLGADQAARARRRFEQHERQRGAPARRPPRARDAAADDDDTSGLAQLSVAAVSVSRQTASLLSIRLPECRRDAAMHVARERLHVLERRLAEARRGRD